MDERPALARLGHAAIVAQEATSATLVVHAGSIQRYVQRVHGRVVVRLQTRLLIGSIANDETYGRLDFVQLFEELQ